MSHRLPRHGLPAAHRVPDEGRPAAARARLDRALGAAWTSTRGCGGQPAAATSSCCTTGRPTPTAISTWARRSTRSSRTWSIAASRCWARTRPTCRAGTATACRSSGRSSRSTARGARTRTRSRSPTSARSAASSPSAGSTSSATSSSAWACSATGTHPYTTMDFAAEAGIFRELAKFLLYGSLYRGKKSVMWSVGREDRAGRGRGRVPRPHQSTTIWVRFPLISTRRAADLEGAAAVIWTTTPWTIPANRAIAYGRTSTTAVAVDEVADAACSAGRAAGRRRRAARRRSPTAAGIVAYDVWPSSRAASLPARSRATRLPASPTATVSTCPCCRPTSSPPTRARGSSTSHPAMARTISSSAPAMAWRCRIRWPRTAPTPRRRPASTGLHVFKAAEPVIDGAQERGDLLARGTLVHSYPHSWRSQGAADLPRHRAVVHPDGRRRTSLREKALAAIDATRWVPARGRNRIRSMIESRPDWCVSRQRAWGVPIAVFVAQGARARCCATPRWSSASPRPSRPRARTPGGRATRRTSWASATPPPTTRRSTTSWTSGSTAAAPMPPCSSSGPSCSGRPRSTSRAPTSIAAGSTPRCSRAAAPAAGRPTTPS